MHDKKIINTSIEMLKVHDQPFVVKSLCQVIEESSKITLFYPDLLNESALGTLLKKLLTPKLKLSSLDLIYESLRNIMDQTKIPIRYLVASSVLKLTESQNENWAEKEDVNVENLLKVLAFNIKTLSKASQVSEEKKNEISAMEGHQFKGLITKTIKYSLMAMTNVLIKTKPTIIFSSSDNLL
jgi:flagellar biosynthesis component FlhA